MINATNDYYLSHGMAVIHKSQPRFKLYESTILSGVVLKLSKPILDRQSTTDYSGVYEGFYIDFEAKETRQKNAFPMKNFHSHQIQHMEQVLEQKGICFVLIHFSSIRKHIYYRRLTLSVFINRIWGKNQCRLIIFESMVM